MILFQIVFHSSQRILHCPAMHRFQKKRNQNYLPLEHHLQLDLAGTEDNRDEPEFEMLSQLAQFPLSLW